MQFQSSPFILLLTVSSVITAGVGLHVWQQRAAASGGRALALLAFACAEWSLGYALEIAGADLPTKVFWGKSQYFGIVAVPLLWMMFAYAYSTRGRRLTPRTVGLLSIVPVVTLLLALTTERHGLIWKEIRILTIGAFSALEVTHGLWFWIYLGYSYLLLAAGTYFILRPLIRTRGLLRRQSLMLLIAVLTPWLGNVLYVTRLSPIPHLDITPFAFAISIGVFAWGIFNYKLGQLTPLARDLVIETMQDGMIVLDDQGNIVDINPAVERALGLSASQAIGQSARDVFNATPSLIERYANILETQEEIVVDAGESQIWYELRMSPLVDGSGRLLGRVVTVRDITEKRRTEEALHLSEEKYRKIYENVADVIYETDNQGHLTSISPSVEKWAGYRPEELIGRHVIDFFVHPEQYTVLDTLMMKYGSVNDFEALLRNKDGRHMSISITARILFDANGQGIATEGVLRDITDRKQAEERIWQMNLELESRVLERTSQLQESNAYLTSLIETSIALNESLDLNEVLDRILVQAHTLVPAQALNIMLVEGEHASIVRRIGYQGLETIEKKLMDFRFPISWPTFQHMYTTHESLYIADTARDPRWQNIPTSEWVGSCIGVPLMISNETIGFLNASHGEPNFFAQKHLDMLESLARHASVAIQNARLLDELKKALATEQGMRSQLVQADKLAALGKMVSVIAHEINNPIQTVKNAFYLLEDQLIPGSPAVEYLKMGSAEADRIADLVTQLRGTYASGSKEIGRVDLPVLLAEVHDLLAPQLKKHRVEWCQTGNVSAHTVLAVPNNLKQVFINLILNAMEAMEHDQKGRITVSLRASPDGQHVAVDFQNTGPLIPEDVLPLIFDPFFTTKKKGTGLGLSISYDIVRKHQGELLVENMPGTGVRFTVWLPLAPDAHSAEMPR